MLDALRRGAGNWLSKILLVLLIFAFAIWGIADVFRGYSASAVAKVGKKEISIEEFQQAYQTEIDLVSRQVGRRLTAEQARMFGLDQQTLSRLIGTAALDTQVKELGLAIPAMTIAADIRTNPAFQDVGGKFSKAAFDGYLRQLGMSEARYITVRKAEDARDLVTEAITAPAAVSKAMIDLVHRYRDEKRVVEFTTIDPAKVVKVPSPDEAALRKYYDENKRQFVQPEQRKLALLLLTRDEVKAKLAISDDEIKRAYEDNTERFNVPESRRIYQVSFPNKAAAEKAAEELSKAANFVDAAKALGFKESDIDLGIVQKASMIDKKIAEAAFALKKGEVSKPVEGQFTTVILKIEDVTPGKTRTLDDVKVQVKDELSERRATSEMTSIHDKIEDERSAGKSLKEAAEKFGVNFREIAAIDRAGRGPDEKPALEHPDAARIVNAGFTNAPGNYNDAVDLSDGGYAWIDVLAVTPEKELEFDAVKEKVKAAYIEAETRRELTNVAARFVERLTKGEAMDVVAKEFEGKVEKTAGILRQASVPGLTEQALQLAFTLPKNGATSSPAADGKSRVLFRVVEIVPAADATKEQAEALKATMVRQMQSDAITAYVGGLQTRYGVSVNEAALRQALGQGSQQ